MKKMIADFADLIFRTYFIKMFVNIYVKLLLDVFRICGLLIFK